MPVKTYCYIYVILLWPTIYLLNRIAVRKLPPLLAYIKNILLANICYHLVYVCFKQLTNIMNIFKNITRSDYTWQIFLKFSLKRLTCNQILIINFDFINNFIWENVIQVNSVAKYLTCMASFMRDSLKF